MNAAISPVRQSALGMIQSAHRAGAPLTPDRLRERLGYKSRGATNNVVIALAEAGLVKIDKNNGRPWRLVPIEQPQGAAHE